MSIVNFPVLDQLDMRLMEELERDARQTYKDMAIKLGISRLAIVPRVRRLLDGNVIRIICLVDPKALGYKFIVILAIYAKQGRINDVAHRLAKCERVLQIHLCTGSYNIVAWAWLRESEDLSDFLLDELDAIPGVQHVEAMLTLEEVKVSSRFLSDEKEPPHLMNSPKPLDDLDLKLIRELQVNPTENNALLAKKLGVHGSTIARRLQRLVDDRVIQIRAAIHPFALGYEGIATIGLKCDLDKVNDAASTVASYKQVQYVSICTGRYDITTWVAFQKLSDLRHFITVKLGSIPGLRDTDTLVNHKLVKALMSLPV